MSDYTRDFPLEGPDMVPELLEVGSGNPTPGAISGLLPANASPPTEPVVSGVVSLGNPFGTARDILKDGPGDELGAQLSLMDLDEAIHPPRCWECGHTEEMFLGNVEHCLEQARDAIRQVEADHRHQWQEKLFLLLWDAKDLFHSDWVEGLRQAPQKEKSWAGEALGYMKRGRILDAWCTVIHTMRKGQADD
jgi:hypothetical protein